MPRLSMSYHVFPQQRATGLTPAPSRSGAALAETIVQPVV